MKIKEIQAISSAIIESNPHYEPMTDGYTPILQARLNLNDCDLDSVKNLVQKIFCAEFKSDNCFDIKFLNNNRKPVIYQSSEIAMSVANQDKQRLNKYFLFKQFQITGLSLEMSAKNNTSFTTTIKRRK